MASVETLLTADEYRQLPDDGEPTELVRGQVLPMTPPMPKHGFHCGRIVVVVGSFVEQQDCGRVVSNDAAVITERDPDTVRGPDVAYYSYQRVPKGPLPRGYLSAAPELIFEVRSPGDSWPKLLVKVGEFLDAGVMCACVLDPESETLTVYRASAPPQVLNRNDDFEVPDILPGLRVPVSRFLE